MIDFLRQVANSFDSEDNDIGTNKSSHHEAVAGVMEILYNGV